MGGRAPASHPRPFYKRQPRFKTRTKGGRRGFLNGLRYPRGGMKPDMRPLPAPNASEQPRNPTPCPADIDVDIEPESARILS